MTLNEYLKSSFIFSPLLAQPSANKKVKRHFLASKVSKIPNFKRDYSRQYAGMYWQRLEHFRSKLLEKARNKWPNIKYVDKLLDVEPGVKSMVFGTIYVEMPLKPNILEEISNEFNISIASSNKTKYFSENDKVTLEDISGRVELSGEFLKSDFFVTGVVIAAMGYETPEGTFELLDCCYPDLESFSPFTPSQGNLNVLFLSGLEIHRDSIINDQQLLIDYINGELGSFEDHKQGSKIARVIIAGNSIKPNINFDHKKDDSPFSTESIQLMDRFLCDILSTVSVDLMPGETDPTSQLLPQNPLHRKLFEKAQKSQLLGLHTNPFEFEVNGLLFLGTSGQNLQDLLRYTDKYDPLFLAEKTLIWNHIAPTAPDTLCTFPYDDNDPFIIKKTPNVYFIGNQDKFQFKKVQIDNHEILIILVPTFAKTKSAVLLNIETFEVKELCF